jgi:hypothetical protein
VAFLLGVIVANRVGYQAPNAGSHSGKTQV